MADFLDSILGRNGNKGSEETAVVEKEPTFQELLEQQRTFYTEEMQKIRAANEQSMRSVLEHFSTDSEYNEKFLDIFTDSVTDQEKMNQMPSKLRSLKQERTNTRSARVEQATLISDIEEFLGDTAEAMRDLHIELEDEEDDSYIDKQPRQIQELFQRLGWHRGQQGQVGQGDRC